MTYDRLLMLGCGRMGGALLSQWLATHVWRGPVSVIKPSPDLPEAVRAYRQVHHVRDFEHLPAGTPIGAVVLAVKPQLLASVLAQCARHLPPDLLYITIAAGTRLDIYRDYLGEGARLIRSMPNTPSQIGMGMTTLCAADTATDADRDLAEGLMKAVGEVLWLRDESMMDAATAISGSGPAYVFYFMECLISAAMEAGLDEKAARLLVVQTVHGSGELAYLSGEALSLLRADVTSPGGTTEAALSRLMHPTGMLRLIQEAVHSAIERARELSALARLP